MLQKFDSRIKDKIFLSLQLEMAIIKMMGNSRAREKKADKFEYLKIYNVSRTKESINKTQEKNNRDTWVA